VLEGWIPYAIIAATAVILAAVTVILARLAWRRQVRRFLVGLMSRREAISAALNTAEAVIRTLGQGSVEELLAFAQAGSEERRALAEIAERMRMEATEVADLALPKALWPLADSLGAAANGLAVQAGGVGDAGGEGVLDALEVLDLKHVRAALEEADGHIAAAATVYDLTDPSVYGGGLYI